MHAERRPNPDRSREALEARLRALPPPAVPADLEARLLAAVPARRRSGRPWRIGIGLAGALAAACLIAVLTWLRDAGTKPAPTPPPIASVPQYSDDATALLAARQVRSRAEGVPFTWPLEESSPLRATSAIPSELLH